MLREVQKNTKSKRKKGMLRKKAFCETDKRSPVNLGETVPKGYLSKMEDFVDP